MQAQRQHGEQVTDETGRHHPPGRQVALEGMAGDGEGGQPVVPEADHEVAPAHHHHQPAQQHQQRHDPGPAQHADPRPDQRRAVGLCAVQPQAAQQRFAVRRQIGEVFERGRRLDAERGQQHRPVGIDQADGQKRRRQHQHGGDQRGPPHRPETHPAAAITGRMRQMTQTETIGAEMPARQGQRHPAAGQPGQRVAHALGNADPGRPACPQQPDADVVQKECPQQQPGRHQQQAHQQPDTRRQQQMTGEAGRHPLDLPVRHPPMPGPVQPPRPGQAEQQQQAWPAKDAIAARQEPQSGQQQADQQLLLPGGPCPRLAGMGRVAQRTRPQPGAAIQILPAAPAHPGPVQAQRQHHRQHVADPDPKVIGPAAVETDGHALRRQRGQVLDWLGSRLHGSSTDRMRASAGSGGRRGSELAHTVARAARPCQAVRIGTARGLLS